MFQREIVNIFVGQAGCQLGSACWELYSLEHRIQPDGRLLDHPDVDDKGCHTFFNRSGADQYVPRAVFVDLEPSVLGKLI